MMKKFFSPDIWRIRSFLCCILMLVFVTCWGAQSNSLDASTNELIRLSQEIVSGKKLNEVEMQQALINAKARRNALLFTAKKNPDRVMKYLLPEKIVKTLPSEIQPFMEKEVSNIEGTLEIRAILNSHQEAIQYLLITADGSTYYIRFLDHVPSNLTTGAKIKLNHGYEIEASDSSKEIMVYSQDFMLMSMSLLGPLPGTFGPQKTIAILVNFQDKPTDRPFTVDQIKNTLFTQVSNIYNEASYKQTTVEGIAIGWYVIPVASTAGCNVNNIATFAETAAINAGVDLSPYKRRIYVFPRNNACGFAGLATVGGNPSKAWINGYNLPFVFGHELGHNLGLYHAAFLKCPGSSTEGNCTSVEYGDNADMMGASYIISHFNAFAKERLGWLNYLSSPPIKTVTTSGTYPITQFEMGPNTKALKILKKNLPNGSKDYYYLEFRRPKGFDSGLACSGCDFTKGILFHLVNTNNLGGKLIDMTPLDNNSRIVALLPGETYKDPNAPNGGVTITVTSLANTQANVNVTIGGLAPNCVRMNPTLSITPMNSQLLSAGNFAHYTMTLTNNDTDICPAARFAISAENPVGMQTNFAVKSINLMPGKSASLKLEVKTSKKTAAGIYSVGITSVHTFAPNNKAHVDANLIVQN